MKISDFIRGDILSRMIIAGERRQFISGAGYWFYPLPRYLLLFLGFILVSACSSGGGGGGSGGPSGSPSAITVSNLQVVRGSANDQFILSWTNPTNPPSNITGFEINFAGTHPLVGRGLQVTRADLPADAFTKNSGENLRAGTNVTITVTSVSTLTNGIEYSWSVRLIFDNSVDSIRASQPSNRVATTLAPEVVQIFGLIATQVNADSIKLQWINPQNSDISSFNLTADNSGTISTRVLSSPAIRGAAQRVEHVVNGFNSGTYELTLTPILGGASASLETRPRTRNNVAVVPAAQFSVDMEVTAYQNTPGSIILEWTNPTYVRIESFNISYSVDSGDDVNVSTSGVTTLAGASARYELSNLAQGGSYSLKVIPIFQTIDAGIMVERNTVETEFDPNAVDTDGDGVFDKSDVDKDNDGLIEVASIEELNYTRYNLAGSRLAKSSVAFGSGAGCPTTGCNGYELVKDLDFAGSSYLPWNPIGGVSSPFSGIFEGNGYTLSNPIIGKQQSDGTGLFGAISNQIRNVHLLNISFTGDDEHGGFVGGLVGAGNGASIINSSVRGGSISLNATLVHSTGGLVGLLNGGRIESSYVELSNISGGGIKGGLVGAVGASSSTPSSEIISSYATIGTIETNSTIGGLIGDNDERSDITIEFSYAAIGNFISSGDEVRQTPFGGILGQSGGNFNIHSSYAIVKNINITIAPDERSVVIGGLVGNAADSSPPSSISSSYYDNSTLSIVNASGDTIILNRLGIGKTTAELQNPTTYSDIYADWGNGWCHPQTGSFTRDRNVAIRGGYSGDEQRAWDLGTDRQYPTLRCFLSSNRTMQVQSIDKALAAPAP